jgi:hypothetical protein
MTFSSLCPWFTLSVGCYAGFDVFRLSSQIVCLKRILVIMPLSSWISRRQWNSDVPRIMGSVKSIMKSTSDQTSQIIEAPKARRAVVLSIYVRMRRLLNIRSYCNRGSNSATCPSGWVISRLLTKDCREIPCLCIL